MTDELTAEQRAVQGAWRVKGFQDADAGRPARTPLRDDGGLAAAAYLAGYRAGARRKPGHRTPRPV